MKLLYADWPAPKRISALTTTRQFGSSQSPYDHGNIALHVGDQEDIVLRNRQELKEFLKLQQEPQWLQQVHGTDCVIVEESNQRTADATITRKKNMPLVIMTGDCIPIVLCNHNGTEIAAIHAGWKGLFNGVVENTLSKMLSSDPDLLAWIGPGICKQCYEVGDEVYTSFISKYPFSRVAFVRRGEKWLADLALICELILNFHGVESVFQSNHCTFEMKNDYYSYRLNQQTGRMATLIWINELQDNSL